MSPRLPPAWRITATLDRSVYLLGTDVLNIALRFQHDGEGPANLRLGLTGRDPWDLWLKRLDGREERWIEGVQVPAAAVHRFDVRVGRAESVAAWRLLDPLGSGLSPGSWLLRARFRFEDHGATMMSTETGFELLPPDVNDPWQPPGYLGRISREPELILVAERERWHPSDGPLEFHVLFREGAAPPRIGRTGLAGLTYLALKINGPDAVAAFSVAQQAAWPRAVPAAFRLVNLATGQRLGTCLRWNPLGLAFARSRRILSLPTAIIEAAPGPAAPRPGRYRVRAVYVVDKRDEAVSAYGLAPLTLQSNEVTVEIDREVG